MNPDGITDAFLSGRSYFLLHSVVALALLAFASLWPDSFLSDSLSTQSIERMWLFISITILILIVILSIRFLQDYGIFRRRIQESWQSTNSQLGFPPVVNPLIMLMLCLFVFTFASTISAQSEQGPAIRFALAIMLCILSISSLIGLIRAFHRSNPIQYVELE